MTIRVFIDQTLYNGNCIKLNDRLHHYLRNVMRLDSGSRIQAFNPRDGEWNANLSIEKKCSSLTISSQVKLLDPEIQIDIACAFIKNVTPSFLIQKFTELGATKIWPVHTNRSVIRTINLEKLILSAIEASEQSLRISIPEVNDIISLEKFLSSYSTMYDNIFLCHTENGLPLMPEIFSIDNVVNKRNIIIVGPEGGFDDKELEYFNSFNNLRKISLGQRVLRAETASIAALAIYSILMEVTNKPAPFKS